MRRFLQCTDGSFLFQVAEEPVRTDGVLDLILTKEEGLASNVKVKGSLDFSDHKMVKILKAVRRVQVHSWNLGEQALAFSKICLVEYFRTKP